jgi:hypothetical protein
VPKQTLQQEYAKGLEAMGFTEVESRSAKYRTFHDQQMRSSIAFVYLGKSGAVRFNSVNRVDGSIDTSIQFKQRLLAKARGFEVPGL